MIDFRLGPDVITRLILHRRPFLMLDGISAYEHAPRPALRGYRHISSNEAVFEGHFPGLHLWPGVYTIEGLGQTANVLFVLEGIIAEFERRGHSQADALAELENLELGFRLAPRYDTERARKFLAQLAEGSSVARGGMAAAVDVKLLKPVFAGQRLDYSVVLTHVVESIARCEVEAEVAGQLVAKGTISSTMGAAFPSK